MVLSDKLISSCLFQIMFALVSGTIHGDDTIAREWKPTHEISNSGFGVLLLKSPGFGLTSQRNGKRVQDGTKVIIIETRRDDSSVKLGEWCHVEAAVEGGLVRGWVSRNLLRKLRFNEPGFWQTDLDRQADWSSARFGIAENPLGALTLLQKPRFELRQDSANRIGLLTKGTLVELLEHVNDPRLPIRWRRVRVRSGKLAGLDGWVANEHTSRIYEIRLRTFIPSPMVSLGHEMIVDKVIDQMIFKGDDRCFSYNKGSNRSFQNAIVTFNRSPQHQFVGGVLVGPQSVSPLVVEPERIFGETIAWNAEDGVHVKGKPFWWWELNGRQKFDYGPERLEVSNQNNRVRADFLDKNVIRVRFDLNASNPLFKITPAPPINAEITVLLYRDENGRVSVESEGQHDGFPAYELYVNGEEIYRHDPVNAKRSPMGLVSLLRHNFSTPRIALTNQ